MARRVIRNPLLLPELFHCVLDHIDEPLLANPVERDEGISVHHVSPEARKAFYALAQTCRATSEPSLDRLWRTLHSLLPLIRCFAPVVDRKRATTPPSPAQWAIIRRYAVRVRELHIHPHLSLSLYFLRCTDSRPLPLLPNLRVLIWDPSCLRSGFVLLVQRLLVPGLVSLDISFKGSQDSPEQLFERYAIICPNLRALRLDLDLSTHCHERASRALQALSDSIPRLTKVENLTLSKPLDPIPTKYVILSAQYKVLRIMFDRRSIQQTISSVDTPFPCVRAIELQTWDFGFLTSLLRPHQQIFHSVTFKLHSDEPQPPARTILSCFAALATPQRINSVHTINVYHSLEYPADDPQAQALEDAPVTYCITCETLSPLASLRCLRIVQIELENQISLDDDELGVLTRNWPSLEVLRLDCRSGGWPWSSAKYVTLRGLLALIVACPELRILCFPIDARIVPMDASPDIRNKHITHATFPYSLISKSGLVAKFLRVHLPSVRCTARDWGPFFGRDVEHVEGYERKWEEVEDMLLCSMCICLPPK